MTMPARAFAMFLGLASLTIASSAFAEENAGSITLKPTVVVGRYARPTATVEVARARPEIKLKDLQDPKVELIMRAAAKAPF